MSTKLLDECIEQFELHGFEPEFNTYFMKQRRHLLSSMEVACGLVVLTAQEEDDSAVAAQLLSLLLDEARMALENDAEYAEDFLEAVEMTIKSGVSGGALQPPDIMEFAALYKRAGLSVPQSLMLDFDNMPAPQEFDDVDPSKLMQALVDEVTEAGGSAFDLFGAIDSMLAVLPEELQSQFINYLITLDNPLLERCALFLLLSPSEPVQEATLASLQERFKNAMLSMDTVRLLPTVRGWLTNEPIQKKLDALIKETRRVATLEQYDPKTPEIQRMVASITDGAGAQSITVLLEQGSDLLAAMILTKAGQGIKDSFLVSLESREEAEFLIEQLNAETGADDISAATLHVLLEGALADGRKNGQMPAPGFIDVIEACNLLELRPRELDLEALLDLADPNRKIKDATAQAVGRWIKDEFALDLLEDIAGSWFEDTTETREIIISGRTALGIETKIWKFLDTRRDIWARRFLQTAVMLRDAERLREWRTLTASAYGLMKGRDLKRIPLMENITYTTIEVADSARWDL